MSPPSELTCKKIVEEVRKGGDAAEAMAKRIDEKYKGYAFSISQKRNVPYEVAVDAYADAVTELVKRIREGTFNDSNDKACSTFIYTVCNNRCIDHFRKQGREPNFEVIEDIKGDSPSYDPREEQEKMTLTALLEILGGDINPTCIKILMLHIQGYKPQEISDELDMKSANSVSVTKSNCIKEITRLVREKYKDFF